MDSLMRSGECAYLLAIGELSMNVGTPICSAYLHVSLSRVLVCLATDLCRLRQSEQ